MTSAVDWRRELSHTWPLLSGSGESRMKSAPVPQTANGSPVLLGRDQEASRHLLVPLGDEQVAPSEAVGAVTVRTETYHFAGSPQRYLDIACHRSDMSHLFDEVLVEVLDTITDAPRPATSAVHVVGLWRELLRVGRGTILSHVEQMALFAELSVLEQVVAPANWVDCWRGPHREPHDILAESFAIEVKAIGASSREVEIHGIRQLDPPGRPLWLCLVELDEGETGFTIAELAENMLQDAASLHFRRLLGLSGYLSTDQGRYTTRFVDPTFSVIEVTSDFPRIVDASFGVGGAPAGLVAVNYKVDLAHIRARSSWSGSDLASWDSGLW